VEISVKKIMRETKGKLTNVYIKCNLYTPWLQKSNHWNCWINTMV